MITFQNLVNVLLLNKMEETNLNLWSPGSYGRFEKYYSNGEFTLDQIARSSSDGKHARIGEIVCLTATILIIILLLCIWILYEIKESDV